MLKCPLGPQELHNTKGAHSSAREHEHQYQASYPGHDFVHADNLYIGGRCEGNHQSCHRSL